MRVSKTRNAKMKWMEGRTEDGTRFTDTSCDIVLFHSISHRNTDVPLKPFSQPQPMIVVALNSQIQYPLNPKIKQLLHMLLGRNVWSQKQEIGEDGGDGEDWEGIFGRWRLVGVGPRGHGRWWHRCAWCPRRTGLGI